MLTIPAWVLLQSITYAVIEPTIDTSRTNRPFMVFMDEIKLQLRCRARAANVLTFAIFAIIGAACASSACAETEPASRPSFRMVAAVLQEKDSTEPGDDSETQTAPKLNADELTNANAVAIAIEKVKVDGTITDEQRERILKPLGQAIKAWKQRQQDAEKLASAKKALSTISTDTADARTRADAKDTREVEVPKDRLSLERLKADKAEQDIIVGEARTKLQDINTKIGERETRRTQLPKLIAEAKQRFDELKSQPVADSVDDEDGQVTEARKVERTAQIASVEQLVKTLESELKLIEAESELLPLQKALAEREFTYQQKVQQEWAKRVQSSKEAQVIRDLNNYRDELAEQEKRSPGRSPLADQSIVLRSQADWTELLSEDVINNQTLAQEQTRTQLLKQTLTDKSKTIEIDLKNNGGIRPSLGIELQDLQSKLGEPSVLDNRIDEISEKINVLQSRQTELQLQSQWGSQLGNPNWDGLPAPKAEMPATERRLALQYQSDLSDSITTLVKLQTELSSQRDTLFELRELIDQHVVWIRNFLPFGWREANTVWPSVQLILHPTQLWKIATACWKGLKSRIELTLLLTTIVVILLVASSRLRRRLDELAKRARSRRSTTMRPTWSAIVLTIALTLPLFVLLYLVGEAIEASNGDSLLVKAYASGFKLAAYVILPMEFLRQMLRRNGLAIAHFDADPKSVDQLRQGLRVLIDLGVPLLVLWRVCEGLNEPAIESSLSRCIYVLGMGLVALFFWQSLHPQRGVLRKQLMRHPDGWLSRLRGAWFPLIIAVPLVLAGFSLAGYQYASHALAGRGYGTAWLVVGTYLTSGLLWRWLVMQRRRVAFALFREKQEEADRVGMEGFEVESDATLAADQINAQTNRLFQTTIATAAIIGLYLVWSPVLPAAKALDMVELWQVRTFDAEGQVTGVQPFTLANVIGVIPIVVLTWAAVRNLPGLVEGFLLERLPIDKASRYAITSLGTYLLAAFGIFLGAKACGLEWGSIQWLVAALGVGLGFGLQEIFANFISGIILLFEQPIRVGDIITLGDTTGVVSRIRIRATTVTNWDRQELVVPNKDLITGRLINWTLTDSTNRIVIKVGVAYGSDTQMACEILREICQENTSVLDDPGPLITFEGFGDSTLDLVLRCYLSSLDARLTTIHELHSQINLRFAEAGIEIAFPQRDLHIRSMPPNAPNHSLGLPSPDNGTERAA